MKYLFRMKGMFVVFCFLIALTACGTAQPTRVVVRKTATPLATAGGQAETAQSLTETPVVTETTTVSESTEETSEPATTPGITETARVSMAEATEPAATIETTMPKTATGVTDASPEAKRPLDPISSPETEQLLNSLEIMLQQVYEKVNPSVVNISVSQKQRMEDVPFHNLPFPTPPQGESPDGEFYSYGNGSGFVWSSDGYIVTNSHVVHEAERIMVTFSDGTMVEGKLIGEDPDSDLAVIKVDVSSDMLHTVEVFDSSQVKVGQLAIAIGNPFGLQGTMTVGFVSALGRTLPVLSEVAGAYYSIPDIIQSDTSINPGNSGGVLVDDQGRLIGVTSAIRSPVRASVGVGFSIPSAIVQQVVPILIEKGDYQHAWLGISGTALIPDMAKEMGLDPQQRGVLIIEVLANSPAEQAGLLGSDRTMTVDGQKQRVGGDVIIAFDGRVVNDFDDISAYLARYTQVGQKITLTILRQGKEMTIDVTLGARPMSSTRNIKAQIKQEAWLGIEGTTLTQEIADAMELPSDQEGVLVNQVAQGSPADKAGIVGSFKNATIHGEPMLVGGDVVVAIDDEPMTNAEDLQAVVQRASVGQEITLTLLRNGKAQKVQVTLEKRP